MAQGRAEEDSRATAVTRKALLVGVEGARGQSRRSMEELLRLVESVGLEPAQVMVQLRPAPHPVTYVGKGKLREVGAAAEESGAQIVVCNAELSARQAAELTEKLDLEVRDRTEIILEIFARHAHTREGKLQVELARLEYLLPRLMGQGLEMSQIAGGRVGGGSGGVRGPGETKLELNRRTLRRRMHRLRERLREIVQHREVERGERRQAGLSVVGLVGYTNAGKSSLLNALAGETVVSAHDRLFETLDTTIGRVDLGERTEALVSDTVGFIDRLPTDLISAFRATLEETVYADLLVEVLDAADEFVWAQHRTVVGILADLEVADKPRLVVLNKADLLAQADREELQARFPEALVISATTGEGLDELREEMRAELTRDLIPLTVQVPYDRLQLLALPAGQGVVVDQIYEPEGVTARLRVHPRAIERLRRWVVADD